RRSKLRPPLGSHSPRNSGVERVAVDVGVADLEAEAPVETVGGLPARTAGQVDAAGAAIRGELDREPVERLAHTATAGVTIDHDVFDPGPQAGGYAEENEGEGADDLTVSVASQQEVGGITGDDLGQ